MLTRRQFGTKWRFSGGRKTFATNGTIARLRKFIGTAARTAMVGDCNAAKREWVISGKIRDYSCGTLS